MIRWQIPLALVGLLAVPAGVQAQTSPTSPPPYHPATPYTPPQYPSIRYPTSQYPSMHYPTSPSAPAGQPINPEEAAAQRQSGLSESDVRTLLQGHGYTKLNDVRADPKSLWVWQADAVKDGHPVRVGVDYRGQVLVISPEANPPCTSPGVNFGVGGNGVGARLSAMGSCRP